MFTKAELRAHNHSMELTVSYYKKLLTSPTSHISKKHIESFIEEMEEKIRKNNLTMTVLGD